MFLQKFIDNVPEVVRLFKLSNVAPDENSMREMVKAINPDTVKDALDASGISKVILSMLLVISYFKVKIFIKTDI